MRSLTSPRSAPSAALRSASSGSGHAGNGSTEVAVCDFDRRSVRQLVGDAGMSWTDAARVLHSLRRVHADRAVHAVLVVTTTQRGVTVRPHLVVHEGDDGPQARVIGGHGCCDIPALVGACLRHALLILWPEGHIEALDLRTGVGMSAGDARALGVVAAGVLRLGVGATQVFVVAAPPRAELVLDARALDALIDGPLGDAQVTTSSALPQPLLSVRERSHALARKYEPTVTVDASRVQPPTAFTVLARLADLELGIIIGRYARCDLQGALVTDDGISRVHAMVLLRREALLVVDLGSTNGTSILGPEGALRAQLDGDLRAWMLGSDEHIALAGRRPLTLAIDG